MKNGVFEPPLPFRLRIYVSLSYNMDSYMSCWDLLDLIELLDPINK